MVIVQAVERKHFPVGPHAVFLHAGNHAPALLRLIENKIDIILRIAQIRDEIFDIRIETHEIKPAIVVDPRRRNQSHGLFAKTRAVTRLIRHADEIALIVESPSVIEALEEFRIAFVKPTDVGAPVGAAIVKYAHFSVAAAHPKERLPGHRPAAEVPGVGNFRIVAEIKPAALENILLLQRGNFRRTKHGATNAVHPAGTVFAYELS